MAKVIERNKKKYWVDDEGNEVPVKHIKMLDKMRDEAVEKVMKRVLKLEEEIKAEKAEVIKIIESFLSIAGGDICKRDEWKGNITFFDFGKKYKVSVCISERLAFNEQLQVAKELVDQCIKKWSKESNDKIVLLVNQAFKVDKQGKLDTKRILGLRQLKIGDNEWKQAMEKISEAITIESTKKYYNFEVKLEDGKYKNVLLNFSAV